MFNCNSFCHFLFDIFPDPFPLQPVNYSNVVSRSSKRTSSESSHIGEHEWPDLASNKCRHDSEGRTLSNSSLGSIPSSRTASESDNVTAATPPDQGRNRAQDKPQTKETVRKNSAARSVADEVQAVQLQMQLAVLEDEQTDDALGVSVSESKEHAPLIELLTEMFPSKSTAELRACLQKSKYDLEVAVVSLLSDDSSDTLLTPTKQELSKDSNATVKLSSSRHPHRQRKHSKSARSKLNSQSCDEGGLNVEKLSASEIKSLIVDK